MAALLVIGTAIHWLGHASFLLTVEGQRIYHAGDIDFIPEMESMDAGSDSSCGQVGLPKTYVNETLTLLKLPQDIKGSVRTGDTVPISPPTDCLSSRKFGLV